MISQINKPVIHYIPGKLYIPCRKTAPKMSHIPLTIIRKTNYF